MRIGPFGFWEIVIIIIVIALIIGGPKLFKKIGRQGKKTLEAGKKGIENATKEIKGDDDAEMPKITKDNVLDKVNEMQDKIDAKFDEINEDGTPKEDAGKTTGEKEDAKPEPEPEPKAKPDPEA